MSAFGKFHLLSLSIAILFAFSACRSITRNTASKPIDHALWNTLVKKHVNSEGWVNYKGFIADSAVLNQYIALLSSAHPNDANWCKNEQKAYWINAYNAFTVKLVCQHYPLASIKDIKNGIPFVNTVWDIKFIRIEGFTYDLNNLEHNILRPVFKDPRVHAAINCASYSCPVLRNEAYTTERLDAQLDDAVMRFITDTRRNKLGPEKVELSKIFDWFAGDFKDYSGSVSNFIRKYIPTYPSKPDVSYLEYDWKLNEE